MTTRTYNNMLDIVLNAFDNDLALHSIRVSTALRTTDDELQTVALGHDLINAHTHADTALLLERGMSNRIVSGIWAMTRQQGMSMCNYVHQICENEDAMQVTMKCILDSTDPSKPLITSKAYIEEQQLLYRHIADKQRLRKIDNMLHAKNGTHR